MAFGYTRGRHAEEVARVVRQPRFVPRYASCSAHLASLRKEERALQSARTHAVATGKRTELLVAVDRRQRALEKFWHDFEKECVHGK